MTFHQSEFASESTLWTGLSPTRVSVVDINVVTVCSFSALLSVVGRQKHAVCKHLL